MTILHGRLLKFFVVTLFILASVGCSSLGKKLKSALNGTEQPQERPTASNSATRFSDQDNVHVGTQRQYRRMTKDKFEEDAEVQSSAGSLWVMEGQGAYLFSPNSTRLVGDLLNVKLEGNPRQQLQTKVKVISKLLDRLEHPDPIVRAPSSTSAPTAAGANPAAAPGQPGAPADPNAPPAANAAAGGATPPAPVAEAVPRPESKFDVQLVPTRIIETLRDGSYRVKGVEPFMIGRREYKVIVTGIVRPEDFSDDGIAASKLLDSQFDIVSSKKGMSL
jgi:flagellar L-ring protein precursor FlgH